MTGITGMWEVLEALEAVIKASDPNKRDVLAATIDAYAEDFPDDFSWALGGQAPALLQNLMLAIEDGRNGVVQPLQREQHALRIELERLSTFDAIGVDQFRRLIIGRLLDQGMPLTRAICHPVRNKLSSSSTTAVSRFASPPLSPDGRCLAWLAWDHPKHAVERHHSVCRRAG